MALSRSTQGSCISFFTHNIRFAFGHGGDHSGYVKVTPQNDKLLDLKEQLYFEDRRQQHFGEFERARFGARIGCTARGQQKAASLFRVTVEERPQFIPAAGLLGKFDERTKRPQIRLPFPAALLVEKITEIPPGDGTQTVQPLVMPMDFKESRMIPSASVLEMVQKVSDFMEQREDVVGAWFVGVDQDPPFSGKQFSVNVFVSRVASTLQSARA